MTSEGLQTTTITILFYTFIAAEIQSQQLQREVCTAAAAGCTETQLVAFGQHWHHPLVLGVGGLVVALSLVDAAKQATSDSRGSQLAPETDARIHALRLLDIRAGFVDFLGLQAKQQSKIAESSANEGQRKRE